jgi:hypothetical protein
MINRLNKLKAMNGCLNPATRLVSVADRAAGRMPQTARALACPAAARVVRRQPIACRARRQIAMLFNVPRSGRCVEEPQLGTIRTGAVPGSGVRVGPLCHAVFGMD